MTMQELVDRYGDRNGGVNYHVLYQDKEWDLLALAEAANAFENNFQSRSGTHLYEYDPTLVCYYNNNPANDDRFLRPGFVDTLRKRLTSFGAEELGYAKYPEGGDDAGYTIAMIVRGEPDKVSHFIDVLWKNAIDNRSR
jgi:hypothetical protein